MTKVYKLELKFRLYTDNAVDVRLKKLEKDKKKRYGVISSRVFFFFFFFFVRTG